MILTHRYLAETFNIVVLVTNQVIGLATSNRNDSTINTNTATEESYKPALGNTWAHFCNTRVREDTRRRDHETYNKYIVIVFYSL